MDENRNQNQNREKEIDLEQNNNNEVQLDFNYPEIFDTNREKNEENMENVVISSKDENNDDIVVIQDDSEEKPKSNNDQRAKEDNNYAVNFEQNNVNNSGNFKKNSNKYINSNIPNENYNSANFFRNPEQKASRKESTSLKLKPYFYEDIYKDILFFFINPTAGSHDGQLLIDMGVKKVEFLDNSKAAESSAYIFNILEDDSYKQGIALLKDYQERGLPKVIIGGGDGTILKVIEKLRENKIDVQNCVFGLLPLGNNNTLSAALGWGSKI